MKPTTIKKLNSLLSRDVDDDDNNDVMMRMRM